MEMLSLIIALSAIMWYVVDRFKPLWENLKYGKYITMAVSAAFAIGLVLSFGIDIVVALGLVSASTAMGKVITVLALMSGSSAVSEIIERVKGGK